MSRPWRDEAILRKLYSEERLSTHEIAEELGCDQSTVLKWLRKCGIEVRDRVRAVQMEPLRDPVRFETYSRGYERWDHKHRDHRETVKVHRLLAVAEYGFDAVDGKDVHHKNGIRWDNRPSNIELLGHSEHTSLHHSQRKGGAA